MICMSEPHVSLALGQLIDDLKKECSRLVEVEETEKAAVRQSAACRNSINDLQTLIDEQVEKLRADVPYESKWGQARRRKANEDA